MKPTVLLAEGDAELCDMYRNFLCGRGYHVETAADGLDCLEKLRRALPAVLVLDHELCWGGGDGVLAWLREESPTPEVPVILTATAGAAHSRLRDVAPPVAQALPKPFTLTALLDSVRAVVPKKDSRDSLNAKPAMTCSELFIG
jgi:DNA-binding response OmpR family regulator